MTPLTALKFAELTLKAGIPKGVVNILPGSGKDWGRERAGAHSIQVHAWPEERGEDSARDEPGVEEGTLWADTAPGRVLTPSGLSVLFLPTLWVLLWLGNCLPLDIYENSSVERSRLRALGDAVLR